MNTDDSGGLFGCRPVLRVEALRTASSITSTASAGPGQTRSRGVVQFMLAQQSQGAPGMWIHLDVHTAEQLDVLCEEWTQKGARIVEPPSVRPWGMYEMRVQDLDGHVMRVSAPVREAGMK
jgi:hypothetical protein